jgi:hypothetical protein
VRNRRSQAGRRLGVADGERRGSHRGLGSKSCPAARGKRWEITRTCCTASKGSINGAGTGCGRATSAAQKLALKSAFLLHAKIGIEDGQAARVHFLAFPFVPLGAWGAGSCMNPSEMRNARNAARCKTPQATCLCVFLQFRKPGSRPLVRTPIISGTTFAGGVDPSSVSPFNIRNVLTCSQIGAI